MYPLLLILVAIGYVIYEKVQIARANIKAREIMRLRMLEEASKKREGEFKNGYFGSCGDIPENRGQ